MKRAVIRTTTASLGAIVLATLLLTGCGGEATSPTTSDRSSPPETSSAPAPVVTFAEFCAIVEQERPPLETSFPASDQERADYAAFGDRLDELVADVEPDSQDQVQAFADAVSLASSTADPMQASQTFDQANATLRDTCP